MKTSIFIKSCQKDFPYLEWCRKSIQKFAKNFHEVVLCLNEGEQFDWPGAKIVHYREKMTPYLGQQAVKCSADSLCEGDYILFQDSDTIFTKYIHPDDFFINGKPYWLLTPYEEARNDQQVWRGPTEKFLGQSFGYEGMRRHPLVVPRGVLERIRGFCSYKHGVSLDEYIKAQSVPNSPLALSFSEWNAVAAFAFTHCPDQFHWIDTSKEEPPEGCCDQGFSHGGPSRLQEDIAKFREILDSTLSEPEVEVRKPKNLTEGIRTLVEALASLADGNRSSRIPMIHEELRKVGILGHKGRRLGSKNKPKELATV